MYCNAFFPCTWICSSSPFIWYEWRIKSAKVCPCPKSLSLASITLKAICVFSKYLSVLISCSGQPKLLVIATATACTKPSVTWLCITSSPLGNISVVVKPVEILNWLSAGKSITSDMILAPFTYSTFLYLSTLS